MSSWCPKLDFMFINMQILLFILVYRAFIHSADGRLIATYREPSKPLDFPIALQFDRQQEWYRDACQIPERYHNYSIQSRSFDTFAVIRPSAQWIEAMGIIFIKWKFLLRPSYTVSILICNYKSVCRLFSGTRSCQFSPVKRVSQTQTFDARKLQCNHCKCQT